jgi:hypothetical protein
MHILFHLLLAEVVTMNQFCGCAQGAYSVAVLNMPFDLKWTLLSAKLHRPTSSYCLHPQISTSSA